MTVAGRVRRAIWRLRWRKCRHCGAPCYAFRLSRAHLLSHHDAAVVDRPGMVGVHWAHVHGEAHCGAPCSRWRRCRCQMVCEDCEQPLTKEHVCA